MPQHPSPTPSLPGRISSATLFSAFLVLACAALCLIVLRQKHAIESLQFELAAVSELVGKGALPPGELLPPLDCFTPAGLHEGASPAGPPGALDFTRDRPATVVIVFNGGCGACEQALPRVAALAQLHARSGIVFTAVQADAKTPAELRSDATQPAPPTDFLLRGVGSNEGTWLKRVPLVPTVLIIDYQSRLRGAWYGISSEPQWQELADLIEKAKRGWN